MLTLNINGRDYALASDPQTPLLWALRDELGLTGTKYGCGIDYCRACTVWIDGQVELLVYYTQPSWPHFPFQYLSQTLELADRGSIGQILVNPAP